MTTVKYIILPWADNLDWVNIPHYDGSLVELDCGDAAEHTKNYNETLKKWLKKVAIGGIIKVRGLDAFDLTRLLISSSISFEQFSNAMFATNSRSCLMEVKRVLKENNFKIIKAILDGGEFYIEGIRNG